MPEAEVAAVAPATPPVDAPVTIPDAEILAKMKDEPAVPNQDGSAPVEKPSEDKPKAPEPETPKEAALLRSIQQRERRLEQQRARDRDERAGWEKSFEERLKRGVEEGVRARLSADPRAIIKSLSDAGVKDDALASALLNKDAKSPEEFAREALQRAESIEKRQRDWDAARAREANEVEYRGQLKALDDKGALPHLLLEWTEPEVMQQTYALIQEMVDESRSSGRPIPAMDGRTMNERLLRILDKRAKVRQDLREERRKAKGAAAAPAAATTTNGSGHQGQKTGASATTTTTLGKALGERPSISPPDPLLMTDKEIVEAANARLRKG